MAYNKNLIWIWALAVVMVLHSCARMGQPDGGWYDETPPKVVSASPEDKGVNVRSSKVQIVFDEFIKLDGATEKVVISPPQLEQPEIKAHGKRIVVEIKDSLRDNTTYTVDFSDAISDNNENNPMGSYTYCFSTGDHIDTLEVSGYVLGADNLEPQKGLLVGLVIPDSVGGTMQRVSRTDSYGHFVIKGVAPGVYCCYALEDQDGNYRFTQKSETLAFNHKTFSPSFGPDTRQDTLWLDEHRIKDIVRVPFTHFYPDELVLFSFKHENQDRFFLKGERQDEHYLTLYFSGAGTMVPELDLLNPPAELSGRDFKSLYIAEASEKIDTIKYWLRDTMLVNQDTLEIVMRYETTDSLGQLVMQTDTVPFLAKVPYEKRQRKLLEERVEFKKALEKKRKRGEEITDSIMPTKPLDVRYGISSEMSPAGRIKIEVPTPLEKLDSACINLYAMRDSMWFKAPFELRPLQSRYSNARQMEIVSDWIPDTEYSFEVDTLAFIDIYGNASMPKKTGFKVNSLDKYASIFVNVTRPEDVSDSVSIQVQLIDSNDKVLMQSPVVDGTAEFYYVNPGTVYMRAFVDSNADGEWTTGNFYEDLQPEAVFYYWEKVEVKAKWDLTKSWNMGAKPHHKQKPSELSKSKGATSRKLKLRNLQRAAELGIPLPEKFK